jgi:hypothetical protein
LREGITFPLIIFFAISHRGCIQMPFFPGLQVGNLEIPKIETLGTLEGHNFLCRTSIEVRFEAKF